MTDDDLESLILHCTEQATAMSERAVEGVKGLNLLEKAVNEAETRLEQEIAVTRGHLTQTIKLLEDTEAHVRTRDDAVHKVLALLEEQSLRLEREVGEETATVLGESLLLAKGADEAVVRLEKELQDCREAADSVLAQANLELLKMVTEAEIIAKALSSLTLQAESMNTTLDTALGHLQDSHDSLDAALETGLDSLVGTYNQTVANSEKQLGELEAQVNQWLTGIDTHLDRALVQELGGGLRQAADTLSENLSGVKKMLDSIATSVLGAHDQFHQNMQRAVVPAIDDTSNSLHKAATAFGMLN